MGRVGKPHGVRGEVSVQPLTEVAARFEPGSVLLLGPPGERDRRLTVRSARPHRDRLLVSFDGVADREAAEALRGSLLLIPASDAPESPEEGFWVHRIVGLEVVTEEGRSLGRVREVLHNPANDVWVTERGVLVPAIEAVVVRVDPGGGRVVVRDMEGLEGEPL